MSKTTQYGSMGNWSLPLTYWLSGVTWEGGKWVHAPRTIAWSETMVSGSLKLAF